MLSQDQPRIPSGGGQRPDVQADEHRMSMHCLGSSCGGILGMLVQIEGTLCHGPGNGPITGKRTFGDGRHSAAHDDDPVLLIHFQ